VNSAYLGSRLAFDARRKRLWPVLCRFLQRDIPPAARILDLGAGHCDFINCIQASEKHVVDVFDGVRSYAAPDVRVHVMSCVSLNGFADASLDAVFASNLLEHLLADDVLLTVREVRRALRPGGRFLIIQPNFRYCFREYFDDYTHKTVLTDTSLSDLLISEGFLIRRLIPRFLPFSIKGRSWTPGWLLGLYLASPVKPRAGQMYVVAERPSA
jgi:SAM-dependent methyltransferase